MLTSTTPWLSPTDKTKMILQFIFKPQIPDLLTVTPIEASLDQKLVVARPNEIRFAVIETPQRNMLDVSREEIFIECVSRGTFVQSVRNSPKNGRS